MIRLCQLSLLSLLVVIWAGPVFSKSARKPSSETIDFADYYPLKKGTFRRYLVQKPGAKKWGVTQVCSNGASYGGQRSVRTSESYVEWDEEVLSGGKVLALAGNDEFGNKAIFDPPLVRGIDKWQLRDHVTTLSTLRIGEQTEPFKLNLVYLGKGKVSIAGENFPDTIRVAFSINDGVSEGLLWYARGVGMVKANYSDGEYWTIEKHGTLPDPPPTINKVTPESLEEKPESLEEKVETKDPGLLIDGLDFQPGAAVIIKGVRRDALVEDASLIRVVGVQMEREERTVITVINPDLQTAFFESAPMVKPVKKGETISPAPTTL